MNYVGRFCDQAGRALEIILVEDLEMPYRVKVHLPADLDSVLREHQNYPFEIIDELKGCVSAEAETSEYLRVEAGKLRVTGLGPTLDLFPLPPDRLTPMVTGGLYDDWEDDLGLPWAFPLSVYRRQTQNA